MFAARPSDRGSREAKGKMQSKLGNFIAKDPRDQLRAVGATATYFSVASLKKVATLAGYDLQRRPKPPEGVPDAELYRPRFSPWFGQAFAPYFALAAPRTLVSVDRCYVLYTLLKQSLALEGDVVECGVYRGGTAAMMARVIGESGLAKKLYLFDTFGGMPETDAARDWHQEGDFSDTSLDEVKAFVNAPGIAEFRQGFIPETFAGLDALKIAFAHIDVDIYRSIINSVEFIWPRLASGGFIVFDDYGFDTCPGARQAVDDFFAPLPVEPLCLPTGQAVVFKP